MKIKTLHTVFLALPYWRIKNNVTGMGIDDYLKNGVLLLFGIFVCGTEFFFFNRFWEILSTIPMGFILVLPKLISFVGTFMFSFLAYSSIMTTLTALYRSNDLTVFLVSPTPLWIPLLYKWCEIAIRSGITFIVLSIPPVFALYQWLDLSLTFLLVYLICILSLASVAVCVGTLFGMCLMSVFPEKRLHQSVAIVGLCLAAAMIGGMRFLNIENMWSEMPEQSEIIQYFMQPDTSVWVRYAPAALLSNAMMPFLWNSSGGWLWTGINILSAAASVSFLLWTGSFLFPIGWQKSQEQNDPAIQRSEKNPFLAKPKYLPSNFATLMIKDWMILWRDPNIWTQLFMMVPLAAVYILNMAMLPLDADGMQLLFTVSNVGLIGMITAAVSARFLYPTLSREGRSIWISAKAPVSSTQLVLQKILFACPPVLAVSITLLIASMFLLDLSYPQLIWMTLYGVALVVMLCILAVSMGCWFPMFDYQHLMEVSLGKGALLFMFLALMMVATLMYSAYQSANPSGSIDLFSTWFMVWFAVWFGVTIMALWQGKRRLDILNID
jgi:ABC-2 type transport system permease protein